MRVFYNNQFTGYWPVGTAAVVMAETALEAAAKLDKALNEIGLSQVVNTEDMIELLPEHGAVIINDGEY